MRLGICIIKCHFCIDPMTMLVSHQAVPPTFFNKIAPNECRDAFTKQLFVPSAFSLDLSFFCFISDKSQMMR